MNKRQKKKEFKKWDNPIYTTIGDGMTLELYRRGKLIERRACGTRGEFYSTWERFTTMKYR